MKTQVVAVVGLVGWTLGMSLEKWSIAGRADKDAMHRMSFILKPGNLESMKKRLVEVSDIKSLHYGQYLSIEEIHKYLHPSEKTMNAIMADLGDYNVTLDGHRMLVNLKVEKIESLFNTKMHEYFSNNDPQVRKLRSLEGTMELPSTWKDHVLYCDGLGRWNPKRISSLKPHRRLQEENQVMDLQRIQALYSLPSSLDSSYPGNGIVVGSFLEESYSEEDLNAFLEYNHMAKVKYMPMQQGCIGAGHATEPTTETSMDIQLMFGLTRNNATTVLCYNELRDPSRKGADDNQEPFLTFMQDVNAMCPPPGVVSISFADDEIAVPATYRDALDLELIISGLRGTTVVAASGDNGVVGSRRLEDVGVHFCDRYQVLYPGASPFVISVGATHGENANNDSALTVPTHGGITTTGGFSDYAPQPTHQGKVLSKYFSGNYSSKYQSKFNAAGRGIPDVAVAGHSIPVFVKGAYFLADGTSASAPIFAALVSHMNAARQRRGRPSIGYAAPYFYALYEVCPFLFGDVVRGNNACGASSQPCCEGGFDAVEGWDPVAGLGSFNFKQWEAHMDLCEGLIKNHKKSVHNRVVPHET